MGKDSFHGQQTFDDLISELISLGFQ